MTAKELLTRYIRLPKGGVIHVGGLAGNSALHPFMPDGYTGTSCVACFGWCNDARHAFHPALAVAEPAGKGNASQASGSPGRDGGAR